LKKELAKEKRGKTARGKTTLGKMVAQPQRKEKVLLKKETKQSGMWGGKEGKLKGFPVAITGGREILRWRVE